MTVRRTHRPSVIDQASAWVVRLGGDDVTQADYDALEIWLAQSLDHRAAFDEAEGLWSALDQDRAALDAALTRSAPRIAQSTRPARVRGRWLWGVGGMAAAVVAFAVLVAPSLGARATTYVTAPGELRTIALSDGSTIIMNGGSTLSVRMSRNGRRVEMADAEAAFDVAHDASRPFEITVGQSRVEVLGTAFDVRRDAAGTRVGVTRGVVRVSDLADAAHQVRLGIGQSVDRRDATGELEVETLPDGAMGWRTGQLIYDDRPLSEVVADLNRAFPIPIRTTGGLGGMRFTGVLTLKGQDEALRRLESFLPVTVVRLEGVIELRPR